MIVRETWCDTALQMKKCTHTVYILCSLRLHWGGRWSAYVLLITLLSLSLIKWARLLPDSILSGSEVSGHYDNLDPRLEKSHQWECDYRSNEAGPAPPIVPRDPWSGLSNSPCSLPSVTTLHRPELCSPGARAMTESMTRLLIQTPDKQRMCLYSVLSRLINKQFYDIVFVKERSKREESSEYSLCQYAPVPLSQHSVPSLTRRSRS